MRNTIHVPGKHPELAYSVNPLRSQTTHPKKRLTQRKTSYRVRLFLSLFRSGAMRNPQKAIEQLRDNAFACHGTPLHSEELRSKPTRSRTSTRETTFGIFPALRITMTCRISTLNLVSTIKIPGDFDTEEDDDIKLHQWSLGDIPLHPLLVIFIMLILVINTMQRDLVLLLRLCS